MFDTIDLATLGYAGSWPARFAPHADAGLVPGRVIRVDRGRVVVATAAGPRPAKPAVRLLKAARGPADLPTVGDWVALSGTAGAAPAGEDGPGDDDSTLWQVEAVLERAGAITRGDPGRAAEVQVLAANVDIVVVVHPIAGEPNLRRLERELAVAWESGAAPVVVLTKMDLAPDAAAAQAEVEAIAFGAEVHAVNALTGDGLEPLRALLRPARTAVLLGPSGAGKSTLTNALLGEAVLATQEVRAADGRGRHTTVARELFVVPGGGIVIDTPGLRALGLTGADEGIAAAFPDIAALADGCRFRDCAHADEPGCAVTEAVATGELDPARLESWHKLVREAQVAAARTDVHLRLQEKRRDKQLGKAIKDFHRQTGKVGRDRRG